jgi:ABC-2 type transport system permease protein
LSGSNQLLPILAFVARDLTKYVRQPKMIAYGILLPVLQFVVIGFTVGGDVRDVSIAVVSHDSGPPALEVIERLRAVESTTSLFRVQAATDEGRALRMVRSGEVAGAVIVDPDYSARSYRGEAGGIGFVVDNTSLFVAAALEQGLRQVVSGQVGANAVGDLQVVELFPFVSYIQYLTPGAVLAAVYIACFIGGGVVFVEDKVTGRHEGYLSTPVKAYQIAAGLISAAAAKAVFAAIVVTPIALWIAGCAGQLTPASTWRLGGVVVISAVSSASFLTSLMVRMRTMDSLLFLNSVTNMVLFFPSGALYPVAGFPEWLKGLAVFDPFVYIVRPVRMVLFNNGDWAAISGDLLVLAGIGVAGFLVTMAIVPRRL